MIKLEIGHQIPVSRNREAVGSRSGHHRAVLHPVDEDVTRGSSGRHRAAGTLLVASPSTHRASIGWIGSRINAVGGDLTCSIYKTHRQTIMVLIAHRTRPILRRP